MVAIDRSCMIFEHVLGRVIGVDIVEVVRAGLLLASSSRLQLGIGECLARRWRVDVRGLLDRAGRQRCRGIRELVVRWHT